MNMERDYHGGEGVDVRTELPSNPQLSTSMSSNQIFHETAGWRHLETSMQCLQSIVQGCGSSFAEMMDINLLELIYLATRHTNRFVRETGYHTLASIIDTTSKGFSVTGADDVPEAMEIESNGGQEPSVGINMKTKVHCESLAKVLAYGLADNWSQVRLAASTASRSFLSTMPKTFNEKHIFYSMIIPRICLNRYYLAEGVRIHSQETWRMVTASEEGGGKKVVERYIEDVVQYYMSCTKADNHAVREAACQCIAEVAAKLDKNVVKPHVDVLLNTLLECFGDDSWPVRDMACVAAGKFVMNYPGPSKRCITKLQELFLVNLQDAISSVRQGAALALKNMVQGYENSDSEKIVVELMHKIQESLENISQQSSEGKRFGDLDTSSTQSTFGVAKRIRDNDPELHTDQTMYSCGSLAPKMGRGSASKGGCSDCKFQKESEPWEAADGAVLLVCELTNLEIGRDKIIKSNIMIKVADACRCRHYVSHYFFLETVLKTLPIIGKNLGKRTIKIYLEEFLDHIFYAAECENALASTAAYRCIKEFCVLLGPNIMRGRIKQFNSKYLNILDDAISFCDSSNLMPNSSYNPGLKGTPAIQDVASPMNISSSNQPSLGGTPTGSPI